jgi:hypothetical protein
MISLLLHSCCRHSLAVELDTSRVDWSALGALGQDTVP